ncbi:MAG: hypothetical protein WC162_01690 [Sphaerochaetaceae bacterium]|nr:hypothetical protein [Sphaerochaetaceae bacterium]
MALKKNPSFEKIGENESIGSLKTKKLFRNSISKNGKENKILTTFSIEPSVKKELEELFQGMGLGWAAGIRFALREFYKKHIDEY